MARDETAERSIFPTFFMGGFECSTFVWQDGKRKDLVADTGHDRHMAEDFAAAMSLGIGVVREAIRWPMVDLGGGRYDWSSVGDPKNWYLLDPLFAAQAQPCRVRSCRG